MRTAARLAFLSLIVLTATPAYAQCTAGSSYTFTDGEFNSWSTALTYTVNSSISATAEATGGNPGARLAISLTLQPTGCSNNGGGIIVLLPGTYDSGLLGALLSIDLAFDHVRTEGFNVGISLIVEQGGSFWVSGSVSANPGGVWAPALFPGLTSTSFVSAVPYAPLPATAHPDFSPGGGVIHVGILASNGCNTGPSPILCGAAIDNWSVTFRASPYRGTGGDLRLVTSVTPGAPNVANCVSMNPGGTLIVSVDSPGGTYAGAAPILAGSFFVTGAPPTNAALPFLHLDLGGLFLIYGASPYWYLNPVIPPGGAVSTAYTRPLGAQAPPTVSGMSLMLQAAVVNPISPFGLIVSDGQEVRF